MRVRTWIAWYRSITLAMLAQAVLAGICAEVQTAQAGVQDPCVQERPLLPLTRREIRHLLAVLIWPRPCNVLLILAWSWWRRCHRSLACSCHIKCRREKGDPVVVLAPLLTKELPGIV